MELASQDDASNDAHLLVKKLLADLEAAWNSGDLHAYAALYAADAGYVSRTGRLLNGRTEIEQLHATAFAGALRNTRLALKARRTAFLTSLVALVHADVEINRPGCEDGAMRAITTFVFGKVDEGWRICAAHTTELTAGKLSAWSAIMRLEFASRYFRRIAATYRWNDSIFDASVSRMRY
jgi:uncharacterized protein (TIGR02246 family)